MAKYTANSPWKDTNTKNGQYLDILKIRPIPAEFAPPLTITKKEIETAVNIIITTIKDFE